MRRSESGISHLLLPIVIIVIAAIVFTGWNVYRQTKQSSKFSGTPVEVNQITDSHIDFGIDLLKDVSRGNNSENHIISPANISIAMAMLYAGADGETQTAIQEGMRFGDLSIYEINEQTQSLIATLERKSDQELSIANSLWTLNEFKPEQSYVEVVKDYYSSTVDEGTVEKINTWASDNTNGKIPEIIGEISADLRLIITSALYFNGTWKTEFNENYTASRKFTDRTGNILDVDTMYLSTEMDYFENEKLQAVSLPYGQNEDFRMLVILPEEIKHFLDSYDGQTYKEIIGSVEDAEGTLYLPKFKQKLQYQLNDSLRNLGMGKIFEDRNELQAIGSGLFVDYVNHDVFMDLNESGTEAAAITSVGVGVTSVGPIDEDSPFVMDVNRPFIICLYHTSTSEPLFMGLINSPMQ